MTVRAVIFDLGHTLWDIGSHPAALAAAYADMRGVLRQRLGRDDLPDAATFQAAVRDVLVAASETYFSNDGAALGAGSHLDQPPSTYWVDCGCRALGLELDRTLLDEITPALFATEIESLICAEGTVEALTTLEHDGYLLGCVTNTLAGTPAIRAMLRKYGIEGHMRSVVVSADEGFRKPHASLFEKAMRELCIAPSESVFVGDSPVHDIAGAKAAGMYAVLTRQYAARPYEHLTPKPDAVIGHVRELPRVIRELGSG